MLLICLRQNFKISRSLGLWIWNDKKIIFWCLNWQLKAFEWRILLFYLKWNSLEMFVEIKGSFRTTEGCRAKNFTIVFKMGISWNNVCRKGIIIKISVSEEWIFGSKFHWTVIILSLVLDTSLILAWVGTSLTFAINILAIRHNFTGCLKGDSNFWVFNV